MTQQLDLGDALQAAMLDLVVGDLEFIRPRVAERSFDIWEEKSGYHYYTQLVQAEALIHGAGWLEEKGDAVRARACRSIADELKPRLDAYWSAEDGHYRSRTGVVGGLPGNSLDIAVILGVLHAGCTTGAHSVLDPKAQATLTALEDLFGVEYPLNQERPAGLGPAIGRYATDTYFGGNPWYLATLAAAEFYFKLAVALRSGAEMPATRDNARFRERLGAEESCAGRRRARRCVHAHGAGPRAAERRSLGTVRSRNRRTGLGQTSSLELCRFHHRRLEPPPGRPGHSRLRSLRDFLRPGVTIRLPN